MAAKLTSTGINFSDGTSLNSKRGIIPTGTDMLFFQAAAPTGWTKQTTHNNKALRVVSGTGGGGSGGTQPFTTVLSPTFAYAGNLNTTNATGGAPLTAPNLPSHVHDQPGRFVVAAVPARYNPAGQFTGWNGGDLRRASGWTRNVPSPATGNAASPATNHTHPLSVTKAISVTFSLGVQYMDVLVCSFNG